MPSYLHPGVYIEEVPSSSKPIEGVATSITAIVGKTPKGRINEAVFVTRFDEYKAEFGDILNEGDAMGFAVNAFFNNGGSKAYIVRAGNGVKANTSNVDSFKGENNGNKKVFHFDALDYGTSGNNIGIQIKKSPATSLTFDVEIYDDTNLKESFAGLSLDQKSNNYVFTVINNNSKLVSMKFEASADPGDSTNDYDYGTIESKNALSNAADIFSHATTGVADNATLDINIDHLGPVRITLPEKAAYGFDGNNTTDGNKLAQKIEEAVRAADSAYSGFLCAYDAASRKFKLTSGTRASYSLVEVENGVLAALMKLDSVSTPVAVHGSHKVVPKNMATVKKLLDGTDISSPVLNDYKHVIDNVLTEIREIGILFFPGKAWNSGDGKDIISHGIAHAEKMGNRMVLIDADKNTVLKTENEAKGLKLPGSTYAAFYYPWLEITNPFYKVGSPATVQIAPSAAAAGMWAKIDARRGVWKAPAGLGTSILGVQKLTQQVSDLLQDNLNKWGINCLRLMPGAGQVIWGARTIATVARPEWRYIPVRRTAIYIEESIYNGIQWAVFEPNNHILWASLRANIGGFMNTLFRAGAFQGEKVSDAYFVRCGLGDTMT
ncbi:MAG: phage tail sheath subtilisin-like domain-containing protein, partial [Gammaproteobacteria bacterium]|nr:phage tail sheath subtilisin-like domain-containing protein [Gammaproteobacteria bacterium]